MTDGMTKAMYESMEKNSQQYRRDKYKAFKIDEAAKADSGHFYDIEKKGFKPGIPEREWRSYKKARMSQKQADELTAKKAASDAKKKVADDLARGLLTKEQRDEARQRGIATRAEKRRLGLPPENTRRHAMTSKQRKLAYFKRDEKIRIRREADAVLCNTQNGGESDG